MGRTRYTHSQTLPLRQLPGSALRAVFAEGYSAADFRHDALAGLVVGIVALPLSMALAIAVGVPPQHGLYTAIVAGIACPLLGGSRFQVTGPTDALAAAVSSSRVAARRLLLLGSETGVLLLAFTVLAAAALRREVAEARRRLSWAGARRWQVELHTFAETGAVALAGTIVGWCLGGGVAALIAAHSGSPAWQVVDHSLLTGGGLATAACSATNVSFASLITLLISAFRLSSRIFFSMMVRSRPALVASTNLYSSASNGRT